MYLIKKFNSYAAWSHRDMLQLFFPVIFIFMT